ncbi:hypothetical protein ABZS96_29775 [Streptomyces avermitilis]|uniref:hypothetical protein n=1 Tax=Streptomyces avermitilis TaxID=33903 RepID=UPI0033AD4255
MFVGMDIGTGALVIRDADGDRPPEFAPRGPRQYLVGERGGECVQGLVLAVPDSWFDTGCEGSARREALHRELVAGLGLPLRQFVPQSVAATAFAAREKAADDGPDWLVCHLATDVVGAGLCRLSGPSVSMLGAGSRPTPGEPAALAELTRAHRSSGEDRERRAVLLLERARIAPRYRTAPVHGYEAAEGRRTVTAGAVIDGFAPVAAALRAAVANLPGRPDAPCRVLVGGDLASHPLALDAVRDALGGPCPQSPPEVLPLHAAAHGALLIAREAVEAPSVAQHSVSLAAHRLRRGMPEEVRIPLTVAGRPVPMTVTSDGEPLTVGIPGAHDLRIGIDVQEYGQGPHRARELTCPPLPGGSCRLGLYPAGPGLGVLVLRPTEGGEPVLVSLDPKTIG